MTDITDIRHKVGARPRIHSMGVSGGSMAEFSLLTDHAKNGR